jgi:hypothetical protein
MGIFACNKCGYTMEKMISTTYRKTAVQRLDFCPKCDKPRTFYFLTDSGMVGRYPHKPAGLPGPSRAALWWRKVRVGKKASAPLDVICPKWGF